MAQTTHLDVGQVGCQDLSLHHHFLSFRLKMQEKGLNSAFFVEKRRNSEEMLTSASIFRSASGASPGLEVVLVMLSQDCEGEVRIRRG